LELCSDYHGFIFVVGVDGGAFSMDYKFSALSFGRQERCEPFSGFFFINEVFEPFTPVKTLMPTEMVVVC